MSVTVKADEHNTKNILSLLEEMGCSLPCNCHGRRHCDGRQYSFDCTLIPKEPVTVELPESAPKLSGIALEDKIAEAGSADTLLIDLGTTTVALALIDSVSGALRQTCVFANPQTAFGADVVSRIQAACLGESGALRDATARALAERAGQLCAQNHQPLADITSCYIGGNTTMIHLLMGYDCSPLAGSPFTLQEDSPAPFWHNSPEGSCHVTILPWLSAFIGGDVTAGLIACRMTERDTSALLIDLGTNGEMALYHRGTLYTAATAAGPAFEGGGLSCGCPGIPGAICRVQLKRLRPALATIDNKLPLGLCGSGAVSLCAELLRHGYVDRQGILTERFPADGLRLALSAQGAPILFTAEDFRTMQPAIAAIAAGIDTLAHSAGIRPEEIEEIFLGGGFGFYLEPDDCHALGMFSSLRPQAIHAMGNTCLRGLYDCAVFPDRALHLPPVRLVSLADSPVFQKQFIRHMTYPD